MSFGLGINGLLGGAAQGVSIGSAIPGIGTAVGGIIGGGLGLLGGLFGGGSNRKDQEKLVEIIVTGKISNYKTSEYLRSGNAEVEDKNSNKEEEANKNEDEKTA